MTHLKMDDCNKRCLVQRGLSYAISVTPSLKMKFFVVLKRDYVM